MDRLAEGLGQVDLNALRARAANGSSNASSPSSSGGVLRESGVSSDVSDLLSSLGSPAAGHVGSGFPAAPGVGGGQISLSELFNSARPAQPQPHQQQQPFQQQPHATASSPARFPAPAAGGGSLSAMLAGMSPKKADSPVRPQPQRPLPEPTAMRELTSLGVPPPPASLAAASAKTSAPGAPASGWVVARGNVEPQTLRIPRAVHARPKQTPSPICKRGLNVPYDPVADLVCMSDSFFCYVVRKTEGDSVRILGRAAGSPALVGPFKSRITHIASYHSSGATSDASPDVIMVGLAEGLALMYSLVEDIASHTVKLAEIVRIPTASAAGVKSVAWSPETPKKFALGDGSSVLCFDGAPVYTAAADGNSSVTFLTSSLLAFGRGASVILWDFDTRSEVASWTPFESGAQVEVVKALCPNMLLTTSMDNTQFRVWRVADASITLTSHLTWEHEASQSTPLRGRAAVVPFRARDTDLVVCFAEAGPQSHGAGSFSVVKIAKDTGNVRSSPSGEHVVEFSTLDPGHQKYTLSLAASRVRADAGATTFGEFDVCHVTNEALFLHPLSLTDVFIDHSALRQSQEYSSPSLNDRGPVVKPTEGFFTPGVAAAAAAAHSSALAAEQASSSGSESEDESIDEDALEHGESAYATKPTLPAPAAAPTAVAPADALHDQTTPSKTGKLGNNIINKATPVSPPPKAAVDFGSSDEASTDEDLALKGSIVLPLDDGGEQGMHSPSAARTSSSLTESDVAAIVSMALQKHTEQSEAQHRQLLATIVRTLNSSVAFHVEKQVQSQVALLGRNLAKAVESAVVPSLKAEVATVLSRHSEAQASTPDASQFQSAMTEAFASAFQSTLVPAFNHASREMLAQLSATVEGLAANDRRSSADTDGASTTVNEPAKLTIDELLDLCAAEKYVEAFSDALFRGNPEFVMQLCAQCEARPDVGGIADAVAALEEDQRLLLTLIAQIGAYRPLLETMDVLSERISVLFEAVVVHLDPNDDSISGVVKDIMEPISKLMEQAKERLGNSLPTKVARQLNALAKKTKQLAA